MDDFSGLEYDQESVSEEDVVNKTNNLLSQFSLPTQVTSIKDISASLFVVLYESLFSDRLPGIVRQPVTREDEISNCQMVIDVLSADVIKDNLSHIRGVDIVEGKVQAINNLLDIFTFLYEYVIKQIESDVPTDTDDDVKSFERLEAAVEESDTYLPRPVSHPESQDSPKSGQRAGIKDQAGAQRADGNGLLKSAGDGNGMGARLKTTAVTAPSPIPPVSNSLMGQQTLDSTADLIREGQQLDKQFEKERSQAAAKTAWDKSSTAFLETASGGAGTREAYGPEGGAARMSRPPRQDYFDLGTQNLSATEPVPTRHRRRSRSPGRMRATLATIPVHGQLTPEKVYQHTDPEVKGLSTSYEDLHQIVQQTAALTRAAIDTSPLRRPQDQAAQLDITDLSQERHKVPPSEGLALAKELNRGGLTYPELHPFCRGEPNEDDFHSRMQRPSASYSEKSHSEAESRTSTLPPRRPTSATYQIPPNTDYIPRPATRETVRPSSARPQTDIKPVAPARIKSKQRQSERGDIGASSDRDSEARRSVGRPEGDDRAICPRRPLDAKEVKERRARLSNRLHEMGKPVLASAQRRLETEDRMFQHKQDFVKKLYEEDFGDVVDEVQGLVDKDHMLMKAMEDEYKKLMVLASGAPKKSAPPSKPKGFLLPKTKRQKAPRTSKSVQSKSSSGSTPKSRGRPLSLAEDEDLMPVLLEEFPNLVLSEHTWHELWRQGITQIESLTRAYEENKRRKSKAQLQLEEAARKHEVLASIVKKQLDHSHRMQQIKDQKRQQVMLNNKMHEKRTQSARARRYYNDYQVRARAKVLKRRSREELIFKNLFKDGLAIQRERIQDVQRYAKEQRDKQAKRRQDEIDSLENFYRDQFEVLVEKLVKDRNDMTTREKAHQKMLDQMKRDLRSKMEREIKDIQSQMFRDDDDMYFRELEADRLRHELQHAKYQTRI